MNKKVAIVEDDPGISDALDMIFKLAGYDTVLHPNGNMLLEDAYKLPDLVILDKQLTGVNGLDVCRHIKAQPRGRKVPVIMLSASPDIEQLAAHAGADAFLEKPFKSAELLAIVEELMET